MVETGVIIAAGAGTRLAGGSSVPKPLRKICGMPLLRQIILNSAKAGLTKIVVVVGFQKEKIIHYIQHTKWPIQVDYVENPDWKKSNGISVLAAKSVIRENFILLMSDHVFDYKTLENFRVLQLEPFTARLAVDYKIHQIFDKDDATKVLVQDGRITKIGKNLVGYNAVDTGMFLLSPAIFAALEVAKKNEDCSLSDGIQALASQGQMGFFDIGEAFWQDVDTKECLKYAEKHLLKACRKSTDGIVSRNFNRYVSLFITSYLVKTPLTANQFTYFVLILGLFTGYLASLGGYFSFLIAGILFQLTSILDGVDGEMSKLRHTSSMYGQWLDTICDNVSYVAFIIGAVVGGYRQGYDHISILGPGALFGMTMLLIVLFYFLIKRSDSGSLLVLQEEFKTKKDLPLLTRILVKAQFLIKRDFFAFLFMVFAIFNKPQWILFLIAVATNIAWMVVVWTKLRRK